MLTSRQDIFDHLLAGPSRVTDMDARVVADLEREGIVQYLPSGFVSLTFAAVSRGLPSTRA